MTQKEIILNHLQENESITSYESFDRYGILDLQKIINLLRKNHNINDEWIHTTNRYGNKVKFKRYWIEEEEK
jgi:hypothetical protein